MLSACEENVKRNIFVLKVQDHEKGSNNKQGIRQKINISTVYKSDWRLPTVKNGFTFDCL